MTDLYPAIIDFLKCRESCFFCGSRLKCRLSNFIGIGDNTLPIINAPLKDSKFLFDISYTSPTFTIKAEGAIDSRTNAMIFIMKSFDTGTPNLDETFVKQVFIDMKPHIQLYCPKKKCPYQYTVASNFFHAGTIKHGWLILPFKMYYESFVLGNLWIQNDYANNCTNIHSRSKEQADPLIVPLQDFELMGKDKLVNRIRTLVTFS
jgi:hypothetical protein